MKKMIRYEKVRDYLVDDPAHVIVTQELVWSLQLKVGDGKNPAGLVVASSLEESVLDEEVARLGDVACVVGVGGGTAIDAAKYIAWKRDVPLVLAPTALTVDAPSHGPWRSVDTAGSGTSEIPSPSGSSSISI